MKNTFLERELAKITIWALFWILVFTLNPLLGRLICKDSFNWNQNKDRVFCEFK